MVSLLTKKEVCELLRCSSRTLDRWRSLWKAKGIDTGEVKVGKLARFKREVIERIINTPKLWT
jgi:predicted site-specific integrase-resolvase